MLYIIGLGLNEKSISLEGLEAIKKCKKVYLEGYTVDFPYDINNLEKVIGKNIIKLERGDVESDKLVKESKKEDVGLLVYGSPLFATTHMTLIADLKKEKVGIKIIYSASIFDAIAETGLQLYKFGKISSMPKWQKNFEPESFLDYVIENKKINAHSIILVDIGLGFSDALEELEKSCENKKINLDNLIVCAGMGTEKAKIYYGKINKLKKKKIIPPYCFIIPEKMHFLEKEILEGFKVD